MQPNVRTYLVDDAGNRVFGPGPAELLRRVRESGSLRAASISMGMAYTKALALVRNAEAALGTPLTTRVVGGTGGGGSTPTPEADALLAAYERWTAAVEASAAGQFSVAFARTGDGAMPKGGSGCGAPGGAELARRVGVCVLASGHATRFGSNKLVEPLFGEPVLGCALGCVPVGLPVVVSSASPEVDALCDARGVERVRPQGSLQADSVRALVSYAREASWDACVFVPGDQPLVEQGSMTSLLQVAADRLDACVRLSWRGRKASPVLFPSSMYGRLERLQGDVGGSAAIGADDACLSVEARWPWELWDIDTPSDLARICEIVEAGLGRGA